MRKQLKTASRKVIQKLSGRTLIKNEEIDFERVRATLQEASNQGVTSFDMRISVGPSVQNRKAQSYDGVAEQIESEFEPHERIANGQWIYRMELNAREQIYQGREDEIVYLDLQNILYGGTHRFDDQGKKPHPYHWATIKFSRPKQIVNEKK